MRKKLFCSLILAFLIILFCSCNQKDQSQYQITEISFDKQLADDMIQGTEECIFQFIKNKENIKPDDFYNELCLFYGKEAQDIYKTFFDNSSGKPQIVSKGYFFPLIYHKNIVIADAIIKHYQHKDMPDVKYDHLCITEKYIGSDKKLIDFQRISIYEKNENGKWIFLRHEGTVNIQDDEINMQYLDFKE